MLYIHLYSVEEEHIFIEFYLFYMFSSFLTVACCLFITYVYMYIETIQFNTIPVI